MYTPPATPPPRAELLNATLLRNAFAKAHQHAVPPHYLAQTHSSTTGAINVSNTAPILTDFLTFSTPASCMPLQRPLRSPSAPQNALHLFEGPSRGAVGEHDASPKCCEFRRCIVSQYRHSSAITGPINSALAASTLMRPLTAPSPRQLSSPPLQVYKRSEEAGS